MFVDSLSSKSDGKITGLILYADLCGNKNDKRGEVQFQKQANLCKFCFIAFDCRMASGGCKIDSNVYAVSTFARNFTRQACVF